jgi:tRNA 2-thiouridine synthesizing protein E
MELNGQTIDTDSQGYLVRLDDWDESVAELMAEADGVELSSAHWEIIRFLRQYHQDYQMAPPMRLLVKAVAARLGEDKGNSRYLYRLFPEGPAKQACRYAGLPKPVSCI